MQNLKKTHRPCTSALRGSGCYLSYLVPHNLQSMLCNPCYAIYAMQSLLGSLCWAVCAKHAMLLGAAGATWGCWCYLELLVLPGATSATWHRLVAVGATCGCLWLLVHFLFASTWWFISTSLLPLDFYIFYIMNQNQIVPKNKCSNMNNLVTFLQARKPFKKHPNLANSVLSLKRHLLASQCTNDTSVATSLISHVLWQSL